MHGRHWILETCRTIEQHSALITPNTAIGKGLLIGSHRGASLRAEQQAIVPCDLIDRCHDTLVRHRDSEAVAFPHGTQNDKITNRLRNPNAGCDRVGVLPARSILFAGLKGAHDGCTPTRLHSNHPWALAADKADRLQLSKGLPHPDQARATAGWIKDHIRKFPAE